MIRGNLATRPFYDERPARIAIALLAAIVVAATLFNLTEAFGAARSDSALATAAARDEAQAAELTATANQLRAGVNVEAIQAAVARARLANDLIDRRTFSWTELFNRLEATLPPDVRIMAIRPQVDRERGTVLSINLTARSVEDVDTFMEALDATGAFANLLPRSEQVGEDGLLQATLEGVYRPSDAPVSAPPAPAPGADR